MRWALRLWPFVVMALWGIGWWEPPNWLRFLIVPGLIPFCIWAGNKTYRGPMPWNDSDFY